MWLSSSHLYLLHRFYSVRVEMSKSTEFPIRMFETGPVGYTKGWEKVAPPPNKRSVERTPEQPPNPNGPKKTSPIIKGPLFGNSNSPAPRNSPAASKTPNNRTPSRKRHSNNAPYAPRKRMTKKGRFAPPRHTRRRR